MRKTTKKSHPHHPEGMRIIESDEFEDFPKNDEPEPPGLADKDKLAKQIQHEKRHKHPAFEVNVPPDGEHRD